MDHLARARFLINTSYAEIGRPRPLIIAKGIHKHDHEIEEALIYGANLITVVGRIPPPHLAPVCIYEPNDLDGLIGVPTEQMVMWNQRDLGDGTIRGGINEARFHHGGWLCQASGIKTREDIDDSVDAFTVGENLVRFVGGKPKKPKRKPASKPKP